jgi:hypothetical protein
MPTSLGTLPPLRQSPVSALDRSLATPPDATLPTDLPPDELDRSNPVTALQ